VTKLHKSFSSLAAELLIVIVGILMAISIDAWWSGIGDRRAEQVLLLSLSEEFEENERALATQFDPYERRSASAETLLRLGPEATDLSTDSLTSLWRWITRGGSYDPATGVLDAAMSSGDITLIRDPALRATLAGWPGKVDNLKDVEVIVTNLVFGQFVPWMRLQTALPEESFAEFGIPPGRNSTDYELLSSSVVVENFLRELVAWGYVLNADREGVQETIDATQMGILKNLLQQ
jgi:hypothetical protein